MRGRWPWGYGSVLSIIIIIPVPLSLWQNFYSLVRLDETKLPGCNTYIMHTCILVQTTLLLSKRRDMNNGVFLKTDLATCRFLPRYFDWKVYTKILLAKRHSIELM